MTKDDEVVLLRGYFRSLKFLEETRNQLVLGGMGEAPEHEMLRSVELVLKVLMQEYKRMKKAQWEDGVRELVRDELRRGLDF